MISRCVVVIGHVDHGKTTLVRALTGIETDRLAEEKERGLSITLGYAHRRYAAGTIDFIDAPGHADFVQTMVAGTTGATAALVVISALEGPQTQTFEHLQIAELLGLPKVVVAVTMADLLADADREARLTEIADALATRPFESAQMLLCSAQTRDGLDQLHAALESLLITEPLTVSPKTSFLPIDRVFSLAGQGTIATGTLLGEDLNKNDNLMIYPSATEVTLRGLHSRGDDLEQVQAGSRVAVNLRGVAVADVNRGDVLGSAGNFAASQCIDVHLDLLPSQTVKHMQDVRVLFGTANAVAQLRLYRGNSGFAQLRFNAPICGFAGQRAILRRLSPPTTIGGATFLDPQATPAPAGDLKRLGLLRACREGDPSEIAHALCAAQGGMAALPHLARLSQLSAKEVQTDLNAIFVPIQDDLVSPIQVVTAVRNDLLSRITRYHDVHPLRIAAPLSQLADRGAARVLQLHVQQSLLAQGVLRKEGQGLALAEHDPVARLTPQQRLRMEEIEAVFRSAALAPPSLDSMIQSPENQELVDLLVDNNSLIILQNIGLKQTLAFHQSALIKAEQTLAAAFPPLQSFTTGEARTALSTSRKFIVPLLEHFDVIGTTMRSGDTRQMTR